MIEYIRMLLRRLNKWLACVPADAFDQGADEECRHGLVTQCPFCARDKHDPSYEPRPQ